VIRSVLHTRKDIEMRPNLSLESIAGALAVIGTGVLMAACGGAEEPKSPVNATDVPSATDKAATPADPKTVDPVSASKPADPTPAAAMPADAKGAADPKAAAPASTGSAKKPAAPAPPAAAKKGGSSCGAGTCSAKK
jgi:hypothetical protein